MRPTALVVAVGAAAVLSAGATAVATPGSVTAGRPVAGALAAGRAARTPHAGTASRHRLLRHLLRRAEHVQLVTSGPRGTFVHAAIRGVVAAVSPTSLTVRAADRFDQTFVLSSSVTRVRVRSVHTGGAASRNGRGTPGSLSDIHRGDEVFALGKSADRPGTLPTARIVVVGVKR